MIPSDSGAKIVWVRRAFLCLLISIFAAVPPALSAKQKPKVRAVTGFVRIDRSNYQAQIRETLTALRQARAAFEAGGYEVQTLRITTQPFPEYIRGLSRHEALAFFHDYAALARKENFVAGIGPAMMSDNDDPGQAELLGEILASTKGLDACLIVASEDGIHWKSVRAAAKLVRYLADHTPRSQGAFSFAAAAMVRPNTPFYPASYHLGAGHQFAVALQSANVVAEAFAEAGSIAKGGAALEAALGEHARAIEAIARRVEKDTGWEYMGIDLSPAPNKEVSIGRAIENLTGAPVGSSGTMSAAAVITHALREIPVKQVGYCGLMVPVLEDEVLAQRWSEGVLTLDALLAYSAICGTGLDVVPLPGDTSEERLARIIGDMASLAFKLHKPLSARLLPVAGKSPGERTEFEDPFLVNGTIQPLR
jgi:uncharacterized protein (UPF0210 family)